MSENTSPISFHRIREGRILGGVCTSLSRQFGVDVHVTRLALAVVAFFTGGTAVAVYVAAWLLIPDEGKETSIAQDLINKSQSKHADKFDKHVAH
ncbi:PspC domain-containing protein [Actinomadura sp. HBU206391]|uniref:PspC domain-containing protein n=1 Tax=Actinomadura sp. HBU206391 TaxID=2731692 RepID=UPI001650885D|nr:PspC domain-containing protein [Actinomadura sp. HBU206391]MBC6459870.1 PspC domain-containing protein [Actinomadura sp. HBU206391]